ncbi:SLAP domain-containing protein [Robertmurraya massiliosenegalensis]|uniref:SLAP domain-containing protein n=1 Tax=Robertmurraya TaxID=2837507 RepID=UPI0039A5D10F
MQQLQFDPSWDKALAIGDRLLIERIFRGISDLNSSEIVCTPIREALNHKEELLITVLVHNYMDQPLMFNDTRLRYSMEGENVAEHFFTIPQLVIPGQVSLPWTFIFPKESYLRRTSFEHGRLEFSTD